MFEELFRLGDDMASTCDHHSNVVLVQLYGTDGAISWHSDDERTMTRNGDTGEVRDIISVSMGASCKFKIKERPQIKKRKRADVFTLQHGDVLLMREGTQERYEHSIAKGDVEGERVSFTFRMQQN